MASNIGIAAITCAAILCGTSPLLAQNVESSAEPSAVFVPQAKPPIGIKAKPKGHRIGQKTNGPPTELPAGAKKANRLPAGVTSTGETYGDWMVNCGTTEGKKLCTISQAQVNKGTGQRVFVIELRLSKEGSNQGTILMPFGLKLETGVVIKVDDEEQRLPFSTCLAQGCLATVAFPNAAIEAIRKAKTFTVGVLSITNDQIITFNVSLNGFGAALDRARLFAS